MSAIQSNSNSLWIKYFSDNTSEIGTDIDITKGKASWSKGRLNDIASVILVWGDTICNVSPIHALEWHQFDRLIVEVSDGNPISQRIARVVQFKLEPSHVGKYILGSQEDANYYWEIKSTAYGYQYENPIYCREVTSALVEGNKWATIVITNTGKQKILLSNKGQFK